ncbi:MAG TPA: SGNH/GDSL hydrolase family protein [Thermoanaerobaculia bacterium]
MKRYVNTVAAVLIAVLSASPMFAARGSANFSNFVALGDSYGAGFTGGSLNERHQVWSWPAVIARQVGLTLCAPGAAANSGCFAQPLVSYPGIGPELQLNSVVPSPVIAPAAGQGQPLLLNFARPYNNLSIPGATVGALLTLKGSEPQTPGEPTAVSMGRFILRGLGTPVEQAIAQHPTFIALWIGGNDYLSVMFSGNPATITSAADFRVRYETLLSALVAGAPQAGMVVGNLPIAIPPYLRLVPAFLVDPATGQPVMVGGNRVYFMVDNGHGGQTPIAPTTLIPLQTRAKLAQGYGLPAAFKNIPPFNALPHVGEPLSQDDVITQEEIQLVFARVAEYNAIIQQAASSRDIPVADINGLFNRVSSPQGVKLGPITVTGAPVTGGFFGLDFFHLTDLGYLMFANEYIRTINFNYGSEIPLASITQLFQNNGAYFGDGAPNGIDNMVFTGNRGITNTAMNQILTFWSQPSVKTPTTRFRGVRH